MIEQSPCELNISTICHIWIYELYKVIITNNGEKGKMNLFTKITFSPSITYITFSFVVGFLNYVYVIMNQTYDITWAINLRHLPIFSYKYQYSFLCMKSITHLHNFKGETILLLSINFNVCDNKIEKRK